MQTDPVYAMHGAAAPGFYGPSFVPVPMMTMPMAHSPQPIHSSGMYVDTYVEKRPVEAPPPAPKVLCANENSAPHRAVMWAGLLAFFSTATFVNGMIRFLQANPTALYDMGTVTEDQKMFPPIVPLIAAVFAIIIGMTGFLTGLSSLLFNAVKPGIAMAAGAFICVLASYVFTIEVFTKPIFEFTKGVAADPLLGSQIVFPQGVVRKDQNAAVTFSAVWCFFGYFFTSTGMIALLCFELKNALAGAMETQTGAAMKMRFMNLMTFMNAVGILTVGCIVYMDEEDERLYTQKWIVTPNYIEFPATIVISGVFLFLYTVPGFIASPAMAKIQAWLSIFIFSWFVVFHWLLNLAHFTSLFSFVGGWMGLLLLMNIFAPVVYGSRVVKLSQNSF